MRKTRKRLNPLIFSFIAALSSMLTFSLVIAFIILRLEDPSSAVGIASVMLFPLSGALSAVLTSRYKGEIAVKESLISSLLISFVIIFIGLIARGGTLPISALYNGGLLIASSIIIAYLTRRKSRRHRR